LVIVVAALEIAAQLRIAREAAPRPALPAGAQRGLLLGAGVMHGLFMGARRPPMPSAAERSPWTARDKGVHRGPAQPELTADGQRQDVRRGRIGPAARVHGGGLVPSRRFVASSRRSVLSDISLAGRQNPNTKT